MATSPNQQGVVGADSGAIWIWTEACVILGVSSPFKMTYMCFVDLLRRHLFLSFYNTSPLLSILFLISPACLLLSRCATRGTLLDPVAAPAKEVAACYHERWELELVYDEVQEHQLSTPILLSQTAMGVMQEAWALLLGHYALRAWMMQSAQQSPEMDVDRLSFTQAICVLGTALTLSVPLQWTPKQQWQPRVVQDLRQSDSLLPAKRRVRSYPRVIKAASTRFFVKQDKDVPFLFPDQTTTWKDLVCPLHCIETPQEVLLI